MKPKLLSYLILQSRRIATHAHATQKCSSERKTHLVLCGIV